MAQECLFDTALLYYYVIQSAKFVQSINQVLRQPSSSSELVYLTMSPVRALHHSVTCAGF